MGNIFTVRGSVVATLRMYRRKIVSKQFIVRKLVYSWSFTHKNLHFLYRDSYFDTLISTFMIYFMKKRQWVIVIIYFCYQTFVFKRLFSDVSFDVSFHKRLFSNVCWKHTFENKRLKPNALKQTLEIKRLKINFWKQTFEN